MGLSRPLEIARSDPAREKNCLERTYKVRNFWATLAMESQKAKQRNQKRFSWVYCATNTGGFLSRLSKSILN